MCRILSVEEGQNIVTILDIGLVGCDGDDLVSPKFLFADPGLQLAGIVNRVSAFKDLAGRVRGGSRKTPCSGHFQFKL